MAGTEEHAPQDSMESNFSFQWDEASQLYFHASSGFYHDPNAGWYYSSRDGLYYTFENGSYVLLESVESTESDACQSPRMVSDRSIQDEKSTKSEAYLSTGAFSDKDGHQCRAECLTSDVSENPPPPSEWLEETLINLYLAGYSNSEIVAEDSVRVLETDGPASEDCIKMLSDKSCSEELSSCSHDAAFEEIEEGEWIPEDMQDAPGQSGRETVEDISLDEENWRAQYGQVVKSEDEYLPAFSALDLWDWTMVTETMGKKKHQVARLIGRLARRSAKLHPSVPAGGGLLKTAAICDAHLDLVRVASGQIYKLRTPSTRYLASLSTYDSANPTKDWGLPDLLVNMHSIAHANLGANHESELSTGVIMCEDSCTEKQKTRLYRDRAAEEKRSKGFLLQTKMKTTKGGKVMNPTDAYRKELRKKELKRNKKERKKVREVGILKKDPETLREQIEKLEMMKADGALDKARKHKKRQLEDTLNLVMKKRKVMWIFDAGISVDAINSGGSCI